MTESQRKGMKRFHERAAAAYRSVGNESNAKQAERRAQSLTVGDNERELAALKTTMQIGDCFALRLRALLGPTDFGIMLKRNATAKYKGCCASHDFCDANMVMLGALCEMRGIAEKDVDVSSDEILKQMNEAWDYAKVKHLTAK